jgi:hypothetical protein
LRNSEEYPKDEDSIFLASVANEAIGEAEDEDGDLTNYAFYVLEAFGLVRPTAEDGWKPTRLLRTLVSRRACVRLLIHHPAYREEARQGQRLISRLHLAKQVTLGDISPRVNVVTWRP